MEFQGENDSNGEMLDAVEGGLATLFDLQGCRENDLYFQLSCTEVASTITKIRVQYSYTS